MRRDTAQVLAAALMKLHGLGDWSVEFDRRSRRAGACYHRRKVIKLSVHFVDLNEVDRVADTIKHEIAHALAGWEAGHGPRWVAACAITGAEPRACYSTVEVAMPKGRWVAACPGCGRQFRKFRRPKHRRFCLKCGTDRGTLTFVKGPKQ